jgi:hypothetical protein
MKKQSRNNFWIRISRVKKNKEIINRIIKPKKKAKMKRKVYKVNEKVKLSNGKYKTVDTKVVFTMTREEALRLGYIREV